MFNKHCVCSDILIFSLDNFVNSVKKDDNSKNERRSRTAAESRK